MLRVVAVVVAVLVGYLALTFVQVWRASHQSSAPHVEAIVVLGAAQYNGRPSPVLKARLEHGLRLYRLGVAPLMVVTGGRRAGDHFTEATTGYNYLRRNGVPDQAIVKEVQGRSTWQSMEATARILKQRQITDVVLISDASHAKRLAGAASELGMHPNVSPAGSPARFSALVRETAVVSVGRVIGYGRLDAYQR